MSKERLMLYFHIPFCTSKCAYCSFCSTSNWDDELLDSYTDALVSQVDSFDNAYAYEVCSVYLGGGTPTVLGDRRLGKILDAVIKRFSLSVLPEITVEANPETINFYGLLSLSSHGFNRISIGAQSFNDQTLRLLNRAHTSKKFVECFENARKAGFNNISADLIFALPNETTENLMYSVNRLTDLRPEHISIYGLSVEKGTPLYRSYTNFVFPTEDEEEEQYFALCQALNSAGYNHYEISNFAVNGHQSRHNVGYWKLTPYFGFGAAAHSFFSNKRFSATSDINEYIKNAYNGYFAPTDFYEQFAVTAEEAERERIMLGLRLSEGVNINNASLPDFVYKHGLATYDGNTLKLTEKGFRVSNTIINMLI